MVTAKDVAEKVHEIAKAARRNVRLDPNVIDQVITELWVLVLDNDFEWPEENVENLIVKKLIDGLPEVTDGG